MIDSGLAVWLSGREGLAGPCSLDSLAGSCPGWAASVARFGPWRTRGEFAVSGAADGRGAPVVVCGECASSLDVAWAFVAEGALPVWGAVLAVSQKAGRGQLRRHWVSPPGNVYGAWRWPAASGFLDVLAPLLVGLVLVEFLEGLGLSARLKWPNDVLLTGKKVGGVLVEERGGSVLAGIGLNLVSAPAASLLREEHAAPAGTLAGEGLACDPAALWSKLVEFGQSCYESYALAPRPGALVPRIERRLAWLGREVLVRESGGEAYRARLLGLAGDGGLRLAHADRNGVSETVLHSGSVSLP